MDINAVIAGIIGLLTTISSAIISWKTAKRKYNAEVDHSYLENLEKGLETYDSIIAHNKSEIEFLINENHELRTEIAELRRQMLNLTMNICMDLTCARRIRETQVTQRNSDYKVVGKYEGTESVN